MITPNSFKRGMVIEIDKGFFEILEVFWVKPGKGGAFARTKVKNLQTGSITEKMFRSEQKVSQISINTVSIEYLYRLDNLYHFMDFQTSEEYVLTEDHLGDKTHFLVENQKVAAKIHQGSILDIELPASVTLAVTQTEPGLKGDRVSGATKGAVLETGFEIQVPLFVKTGDKIKVDTRSGKYLSRA